jgi:hypothetical protein
VFCGGGLVRHRTTLLNEVDKKSALFLCPSFDGVGLHFALFGRGRFECGIGNIVVFLLHFAFDFGKIIGWFGLDPHDGTDGDAGGGRN